MFAGHVGVALAVARSERRVNVDLFVAAALLLDIVLWSLILVGLESVTIPADFATTHQAEFVFPCSHGLLAAVVWSLLGATAAWLCCSSELRSRAAALVGIAVFSHWLLDALVHRPELPLAGSDSAAVGLALWDHMPLAILVEAAIVVLGLWLFLPGSGLSRRKAGAIGVLTLLILVFTAVGMTLAPPPPSALAMAGTSLLTLALVCGLFAWLGRLPRRARAFERMAPGLRSFADSGPVAQPNRSAEP